MGVKDLVEVGSTWVYRDHLEGSISNTYTLDGFTVGTQSILCNLRDISGFCFYRTPDKLLEGFKRVEPVADKDLYYSKIILAQLKMMGLQSIINELLVEMGI